MAPQMLNPKPLGARLRPLRDGNPHIGNGFETPFLQALEVWIKIEVDPEPYTISPDP